jgi:hypothetical protein
MSGNRYEYFDFQTLGAKIDRSRRGINQPLKGKNMRGRGGCVD